MRPQTLIARLGAEPPAQILVEFYAVGLNKNMLARMFHRASGHEGGQSVCQLVKLTKEQNSH